MTGKVWLIFLSAVIVCAVFVSSADANEIPCVAKEQAKTLEPFEHVKGWGVREGGLIKLSVSPEGHFLITLSPPNMGGAVCIVMMGTDWTFVQPSPEGEKVSYGRRN
tara:strand:- start:4140 stop:4460 length:321 start_codon:yes stop_codon:yes gene_type:complete